MKKFCKIISVLLYLCMSAFIFEQNIEGMEQKYPQDALKNTVQKVNFSHDELKKIRREVKETIYNSEQWVTKLFRNKLFSDEQFNGDKSLEAKLDDMHYYTTVHNRISKTLEKNKDKKNCKLSYTLFESDYLFKNIQGFKKIHESNKALVAKIKNNLALNNEFLDKQEIGEVAFYLKNLFRTKLLT